MDAVKPIVATAAPAAPAPSKSAEKTARDFESVFIGQMTKMMMETVQTEGDFSGGHGEEMFRGVLAEQLGGRIAARGGLGIASAVMKQIIALQGGAPSQSAMRPAAVGQEEKSDAR